MTASKQANQILMLSQAIKAIKESTLNESAKRRGIEPLQRAIIRLSSKK